MALISTDQLNVMQTYGLWHKVTAYSTGNRREAITKCGYKIPFPSEDVVFSENLGECTSNLRCQECYK